MAVELPDEDRFAGPTWGKNESFRCRICQGPLRTHPRMRNKFGCVECFFALFTLTTPVTEDASFVRHFVPRT